MQISLNNQQETFEQDKLTISEILAIKNFTFKMLVIKLNGTLVKKADYPVTEIKDGDELVVVHLVCGG